MDGPSTSGGKGLREPDALIHVAEVLVESVGGRVVGAGKEGTLKLPSSYAERLPAVLSLRAAILNANGKVYVLDRAFRIVP